MRDFNVKLNKDVYPAIRPKEKKTTKKMHTHSQTNEFTSTHIQIVIDTLIKVEVDNLSPILGFENESFDRDLLMFGKNYLESNQDEETSLQTLLECEYQFTIGVQMIEWIDK